MNIDLAIDLSDTRNQLHWAAQLLSAAADATLEKAADDSHSNLGWDADKQQMVGRGGCSIAVADFLLISGSESFSLSEQTLADAGNWLGDVLESKIVFRDYEMPPHAVQTGAAFNPDSSHLKSICSWLSIAENAMADFPGIRIWPHHFDMGFWISGEIEGRSIGGGFSLGDSHYNQPYFYINPYGVERPSQLPELSFGHWTENWFGAVLNAEELKNSPSDLAGTAKEFIDSTVQICRQLTS